MGKLMTLVGSIAGSYLGWWAGSAFGVMTSYMASAVGAGAGFWVGRRLADRMVE